MRYCNSCHECCNGNLSIPEINVYSGNPCKFICSTGCSIYNNRPNTCKNFNCLWLIDESIPENMYPKKSGVLVYRQNIDNYIIHVTQEFWGTLSNNDEIKMIEWYKEKSVNGAIIKKDKIIIAGYGDSVELNNFINKLNETSKNINSSVVIQYII